MSLLVNGDSLPVAQLGPDFLLLGVVADHPPCDAVVKLRVDDVERQSVLSKITVSWTG